MTITTANPLRRAPALVLTLLLLGCGADAPAEGGVGAQETAEAVELSEPISASGLSISLPAVWNRLEPRSAMRMLEAEIPGSGGPGEISAFYFGPGGGGGLAANIERWKSQVVLQPGAPEPTTQSRESGGVRRTWVELEGDGQGEHDRQLPDDRPARRGALRRDHRGPRRPLVSTRRRTRRDDARAAPGVPGDAGQRAPATLAREPGAAETWWSRWESNPRPLECHSSALPTELRPHGSAARECSSPNRFRSGTRLRRERWRGCWRRRGPRSGPPARPGSRTAR